jgi:hypothetical protein
VIMRGGRDCGEWQRRYCCGKGVEDELGALMSLEKGGLALLKCPTTEAALRG